MNCKICGKLLNVDDYTKKQWNYKSNMFKKQGYVYCSLSCSNVVMKEVHSKTMSKTNKKYASERMKRNNPTFNESVRKKISEKRKGHAPIVRYGNGSGLTVPQKLLLDALHQYKPIPEYAILTHKPLDSGYPPCYKPDIAIPKYKIAIEADGASHHHHLRKIEDKKKDEVLTTLGWKVIRFWNADILKKLDSCVQAIVSELKVGCV